MYRTGGIVALLIGMGLGFLWAFLPFSQQLSYRVSFDDGQPDWTRVEIECPDPWSVLVEGERPPRGEYATAGDECVKPARTLMAGAVVATLAGITLGAYGIRRGPQPKPEPIEPLSEIIARRSGQRGV
ncbi:MAG: hypothetical protein KY394_02650 [Actinobacteria bacterium]|nr:hypothetical protein [Actinomycetota bacterium]